MSSDKLVIDSQAVDPDTVITVNEGVPVEAHLPNKKTVRDSVTSVLKDINSSYVELSHK